MILFIYIYIFLKSSQFHLLQLKIGQIEFASLRDQYMKESQGFILMYSITSRSSFDEIETFYEQVVRVKDVDRFPAIIVANKVDLEDERQVTKEEGEQLAKRLGVILFF